MTKKKNYSRGEETKDTQLTLSNVAKGDLPEGAYKYNQEYLDQLGKNENAGALEAFLGIANVGLGMKGQLDANRDASRARALQQESLALQFPEELQGLRSSVFGGANDMALNTFGGRKYYDFDLSDQQLKNMLMYNPDLNSRYVRDLDGRRSDLKNRQTQLASQLTQATRNGNVRDDSQLQAIRDEYDSVSSQLKNLSSDSLFGDDQLLRLVANSRDDLEYNEELGRIQRFEDVKGQDVSPIFQGDQRINAGYNSLYDAYLSQIDPTRSAMGLNQFSSNRATDEEMMSLGSLVRNGNGGTFNDAQAVAGDQNQFLANSAMGLRGFFPSVNNLRDEMNQSMVNARQLEMDLEADTNNMLQATEAQFEADKKQQIQRMMDQMAQSGLSGSGFEREQLKDIENKFNRLKNDQLAQIRISANQQKFNNKIGAQQNVANMIGLNSNVGTSNTNNAINVLNTATGYGQQRLGNYGMLNNIDQGMLARDQFNSSLYNQIGGLGRAQAGANFQSDLNRIQMPTNLTQQALSALQSGEARNQGLQQNNFNNVNWNKAFLSDMARMAQNSASQASQQQSNFANQQMAMANQQSQQASRALGDGAYMASMGLSDMFNNRQNQPQQSQQLQPSIGGGFITNQPQYGNYGGGPSYIQNNQMIEPVY